MEYREAFAQISHIRDQLARSETYRGFRAATVGLSGILAVAAALIQSMWITDPAEKLTEFLTLWVSAAVFGAGAAWTGAFWRAWRSGSQLTWRLTAIAAEQFFPCLAAGAMLTLVVASAAPEIAWTLPGLWCLLFGLGVLAVARMLPRPIYWVGVFYILCGGLALYFGRDEFALSPWLMGFPFGVGQVATAAVLYWTLEREDVS